jgi:CxxC motif-containing protein
MKKEMICIVCPLGCHLTIDGENLAVTGNTCKRGETYAREELTAPVRVVTSTVRIDGGLYKRLPVKTDKAIPKALNFQCVDVLKDIRLKSPVHSGQIIVADVLGTGANIVATRDM